MLNEKLSENIIYVHDYLSAGKTDSEIIRDCLNDSATIQGRTVIFDRKDWYIDEAVILTSDTTVLIDGCAIIQKDEVFDNVFRGDNLVVNPDDPYGKPLDVLPIRNIRILGRNGAKIIGCVKNKVGYHSVLKQWQEMTGDFWGWRTLQISLSRCEGFEIGHIELTKTRCWAMSFDQCKNGYVHDLHIVSNVKNGDGINFRSGCSHCKVENITGFTSDDTVACTALANAPKTYPYKNYLYPLEPANSMISADHNHQGDIHDISISNIFTGGFHHGIICLAAYGLKVYNITIRNVKEAGEGKREATVKIYTGYGDGYNEDDISNIIVDGVETLISDYAVMCNAKVNNVTLKNIKKINEPEKTYQLKEQEGINIFLSVP